MSQTILVVILTLMLIMVTLPILLLSAELFHLIRTTGIQLLSLHLGFPIEHPTVPSAGLAYREQQSCFLLEEFFKDARAPHTNLFLSVVMKVMVSWTLLVWWLSLKWHY